MLEASLNADNSFLTLTYRDNPVSLRPLDHRRFMDALRKRVAPLRLRFYCVGEYGDQSERPHLHYALFGYPSCRGRRRGARYRCCAPCDVIEEVWGKGFVYSRPLEMGSARYIARYVVKKMTRRDDPRLPHRFWIGNRHPEFARMSLKPGIGHGVLEKTAELITRYNLLTPQGDVPVTLRHGDLEWPLGRYLRRQLRIKLGLDPRSPHVLSPEAATSFANSPENEFMRSLREAARSDQENPGLKYHLLKASEGRRLQLQRRQSLKRTKGKI